jgi:hypothetical protein
VDYWNIPMECANSQSAIFRLSDENGAEPLFLCFQAPISFRTPLDRIPTALNNQSFCWSFGPSVGGLAELQSISVGAEGSGVELSLAVRVPAAQQGHPPNF